MLNVIVKLLAGELKVGKDTIIIHLGLNTSKLFYTVMYFFTSVLLYAKFRLTIQVYMLDRLILIYFRVIICLHNEKSR